MQGPLPAQCLFQYAALLLTQRVAQAPEEAPRIDQIRIRR